MEGGTAAGLPPVDDRAADAIGPARGEHRGPGHVGTLGPDRLRTSHPDLVDLRRVDRGPGHRLTHDQGGQIDRMPAGEGPLDRGER